MSKNRKKGNSFMEWFSDNLRYILLIGAIFLILAGLFFGVRAISSGIGKKTVEAGSVTESNGTGASANSTATDATGNKSAGNTVSADHGTLTENADKDVTKLVEDYYAALSAQDLEKVRETTDTLPDEQAARISSSKVTYDNIKVYSKNGPDENSRVVYVYYTYQGGDQSAPVPGLSQLYVKNGTDGTWKIVYSPLPADEKNYIDSVTQDADVQALIEEVKKEYGEKQGTAAETAQPSENETANEDSGDGEEEAGDKRKEEDGSDEEAVAVEFEEDETDRLGTPVDTAADEEKIDEEKVDEEKIDEETIDEETIDEETIDEESLEDSLLQEKYDEESGNDEPEEEEPPVEWTTEVNSSCNLRDGSSYESAVVGTVTAGTEVTVIGDIVDGWWHIRTADGAEGYIGGKFID
jgi:SH3-like domain-containing protein